MIYPVHLGFLKRATSLLPLVQHKAVYPPENPSSLLISIGFVMLSLVFCVAFCEPLFSFCPFSFGRCIVLSFQDLHLLITLLIFSNFSCVVIGEIVNHYCLIFSLFSNLHLQSGPDLE